MVNRNRSVQEIFPATRRRRSRTSLLLMAAILPVASLLTPHAAAANLTWDSSGTHPTAPVDGSGNWDTLTADWSNGTADVVWNNTSTAVFGSGGTPGTVTIDDASGTVSATGLTFNTGGNYTIAASGPDTLTLTGASPIISVATGVNATISAPIAGAFGSYAITGATATGLIIKGLGTLTLNGINTYTGSTIIENNGTSATGTSVILNGSLGTSGANVYVGFSSASTDADTSSLTLNGGSTLTAASLVLDFNFAKSATSTTIGSSVNVNGAATVNANSILLNAGLANGNTKAGFSSIILNAGSTLTLHDAANDGSPVTLLDIANYSFENGGATGTGTTAVADFSNGTVNGNITTINLATGKANSGSTGGPATATLLFSNGTLNVGTINVARLGSQQAVGTLTLAAGGTGTINATSIAFGATGQGTQGAGTSSIGTININGATLNLAGAIAANTGGSSHFTTSTAVINLNGGTLNMNNNAIGDGTTPITLNAAAGILSNVSSINGAGGLTTTGTTGQILTLTGTNSYSGNTTIGAGGGTVIANGATAMGNGGALVNNGGTLDLDGFSQSVAGLSGTGGIITNNGAAPVTLTVTAGTGTFAGTLQNGTSPLALSLNSGANITLSSATAHTYTGPTSIASGASLAIANINSSTAVTNTGAFAAAGTTGAITVDQAGSLTPGAPVSTNTTGALNAPSLSIGSGGGTLNFLVNSASAFDQLLLSGAATLNGPLNINATLAATLPSGTYNLLTATGGLNLNAQTVTPTVTVNGGTTRLTGSISETATQIQLLVSGSAANLTWTGAADTTTWDIKGQQNWSSTAPIDPNRFYNADNVTFANATNLNINIAAAVQPSSVTFTNDNAHNYVISSANSNGIGGAGSVSLNGTGSVTLNTVNTYSGGTNINSGALIIGSTGSIAGPTLNLATGAALTVNQGGTISTTTQTVGGNYNISGSVTGANLTLSAPAVATVSSTGNLGTANVTLSGGTLDVQPSGTLSSTSLTVATGATLTLEAGANVSATPSVTLNGTATIASSQTIGAFNGTDPTATLTLAGALSVGSNGTYAGIIKDGTSPGSLTVTANTLTLTGPNTYTGPTTINTGATLQIDNGGTTGSLSSATTLSPNGTLIYDRSDNVSLANTLSGSGNFRQAGPGNLTLTADNSAFSGTIQAYNGTIIQGSPTALGSNEALAIGAPGSAANTTTTGTILLSSAVPTPTVASISSTNSNITANPAPSILNIPTGVALTDNGNFTVGSAGSFGAFTVTGGGSLSVNGTTSIGQGDVSTTDLSALNSVTLSGALTMANTGGQANLILANTTVNSVAPSNTINGTLNISTTATNNASGPSVITLGSGNNTINSSAINLGSGRGAGVIQFPTGAPASASLNIPNSPTIVLALASTNGAEIAAPSSMNLAGFTATITAGSLVLAQETGNLSGGPTALVTFDTGTFTVNGPITIAQDSGGSSVTGPTGTLIIGGATPNNTATGLFTATAGITLGAFTNTNAFAEASAVATATFTLNGGTASINGSINNNSSHGTTIATVNLLGGTLNLNGGMIGNNGGVNSGNGPITVNFPGTSQSATLANLGSGGINGVGLTMNGLGTLNLDGANSYAGPTAVTAGGTLSVLSTGSLPASTDVTVDGTLNLAPSAQTINSLNGTTPAAALNLNASNLTIATGGAFAGAINDNGSNGALTLSAALSVGSFNVATVNANANLQIHGTSKTAALNLLGGTGAWTTGLDLAGNKFILESTSATKATDLSRIRDQVAFGKTNPDGIFNSTALPANFGMAVMDNNLLQKTTFGGVAVTANSILVSPELLGDSNADGHVDLTDLSTVLNNFGSTTLAWTSGNFDGASTIDLTDLSDVLNNFGATNPNASTAPALSVPVATPEPTSLTLLALAAPALLTRRRKH